VVVLNETGFAPTRINRTGLHHGPQARFSDQREQQVPAGYSCLRVASAKAEMD
jgi:hypothetical protein